MCQRTLSTCERSALLSCCLPGVTPAGVPAALVNTRPTPLVPIPTPPIPPLAGVAIGEPAAPGAAAAARRVFRDRGVAGEAVPRPPRGAVRERDEGCGERAESDGSGDRPRPGRACDTGQDTRAIEHRRTMRPHVSTDVRGLPACSCVSVFWLGRLPASLYQTCAMPRRSMVTWASANRARRARNMSACIHSTTQQHTTYISHCSSAPWACSFNTRHRAHTSKLCEDCITATCMAVSSRAHVPAWLWCCIAWCCCLPPLPGLCLCQGAPGRPSADSARPYSDSHPEAEP